MDAIGSGVVRVPRIPVNDDARENLVAYLRLWDYVGPRLPERKGRTVGSDAAWVPPNALAGASRSLYRSYERRFRDWEQRLAATGEPPPVLIVVCPNTIVSRLVYGRVAGSQVEQPGGSTVIRAGVLEVSGGRKSPGPTRPRPPPPATRGARR